VEIFSSTDERLKFLGKILNNDYSRQILLLLAEKEMTANEIASQTISLVRKRLK
jgi:DNA-binding transcriptional ArsR family regulator